MRLIDLEPNWVGAGGEGIYDKDKNPVPKRHGVAISFNCPCGRTDRDNGHSSRVVVMFTNPIDGGEPIRNRTTWQRTGETFEDLTLTPSILRVGGCAWHGFITNGEVKTV